MTDQSKEKFKIYKNVFDDFTLQTLFKLSSEGHFDELLSPIMIGKESNVFLAETKEGNSVIVKIYRLASCNFNKMFSYIQSDPRFINIKNKRRLVIFKWVQREYRNLLMAREKINVPLPIAFFNNVLVMETIGGDRPSPRLKDCHPKDPKEFSKLVLECTENLAAAGLVHGDLSEFNILTWNEKPYFIDFSQATSVDDPNALEYLKRDILNLKRFFLKLNIEIDDEKELKKIQSIIKKRNK